MVYDWVYHWVYHHIFPTSIDIKWHKYGIKMAPLIAPIISSDGPQAGDTDVGCRVLDLARLGEGTYTKGGRRQDLAQCPRLFLDGI